MFVIIIIDIDMINICHSLLSISCVLFVCVIVYIAALLLCNLEHWHVNPDRLGGLSEAGEVPPRGVGTLRYFPLTPLVQSLALRPFPDTCEQKAGTPALLLRKNNEQNKCSSSARIRRATSLRY